MLIAIDFDGTLVEDRFPDIGKPLKGVKFETLIDDCKYLQNKGHKLILWTCRSGKRLDEAVEFCYKRGLVFDAVNDDLEEFKANYPEGMEAWRKSGKARKVFADYYIDDRVFIPVHSQFFNVIYGSE